MCSHDFEWLTRRRGVDVFRCRHCLELGAIPRSRVSALVDATIATEGEQQAYDEAVEARREHLLGCAQRTTENAARFLSWPEIHPDVLVGMIDGAERLIRAGHRVGLNADDDFAELLVTRSELRRRLRLLVQDEVLDDATALVSASEELLSSRAVSGGTLRSAAQLNSGVLARAARAGVPVPELVAIQRRILDRIGE